MLFWRPENLCTVSSIEAVSFLIAGASSTVFRLSCILNSVISICEFILFMIWDSPINPSKLSLVLCWYFCNYRVASDSSLCIFLITWCFSSSLKSVFSANPFSSLFIRVLSPSICLISKLFSCCPIYSGIPFCCSVVFSIFKCVS